MRPILSDIKRMTAIFYGLSRDDMECGDRSRRVARPRQIAMSLCRRYTRHSMPQIGRAFGGRDHTTVIHAIRAVGDLVSSCPANAREIALLCAQIEAGAISVHSEIWKVRRRETEKKPEPLAEDDAIQAREPEAHCAYVRALAAANANFSTRAPALPTPPAVEDLSGPALLLLPSPDTFSRVAA